MRFLVHQKDKRTILFPYNFNFHWILMVIYMDNNRLIVLDSLRKDQADYQDMIDIIQSVCEKFIQDHRSNCKVPLNVVLTQWCLRQKPGTICADTMFVSSSGRARIDLD